ncbi:MAG: response regulator [Ruminococcaceae bacterium]|nr:response regulator [Oscillospiraceae bacterium]
MIRILIIDDSIERSQELTNILSKNQIDCYCDYCITKEEALKKLHLNQYDLVLLDIMLPDTMSKKGISDLAGLDILKAISNDRTLIKPLCVMGITSSEETYQKVINEFEKHLIPLSVWNNDENWESQFLSKIKYLNKLSNTYRPINPNKVDIALIATVDEEYLALKNLPINWIEKIIENDIGTYSIGTISCYGVEKRILISQLPEMGIAAASFMTTNIINTFDPCSIAMVGICGGKEGEVNLGDVIVADKTWDYGAGKVKINSKGEIQLLAQPNQLNINTKLKAEIIRNKSLIDNIYIKWNATNNDNKISSVKCGVLPSGSAVIASKEFIDEIVAPQYRKFLGIDMETYGVYFACENSKNDIKYVAIKSVSDLANQDKDDSYHSYCSYVSANFAYELIKKGIL